jgi:hypothetical protein
MKPMAWGLIVAAFGLGWLAAGGMPESSSLVAARRDVWELPDLPARRDQAERAIALAGSPIFEPEAAVLAAAAAAKAEDKRWRVAGIYGRGHERRVLIGFAVAGKPPLRLGVGDKVPSGEQITQIRDGEVLIRVGKKQVPLGADYRE